MSAKVERRAEMAVEPAFGPASGGVEGPHQPASVFSTGEFVQACARALGPKYRPVAIPVTGSGAPRTLYAMEKAGPLGLRSFSLGPCGLYASPAWDGRLERSTLEGIVARLKGVWIRKFGWKVLFDQAELAAGLADLCLEMQRESTQVLRLDPDYDRVFAGYNATIRNQVRKARRKGVTVREAFDPATVEAYYQVHTRLAGQKGDYDVVYPLELFLEFARMRGVVRLLVAECGGRVAAGGLFFHANGSLLYWHGAADRDYSDYFPSRLVFDEAIRWGCENGAEFLNFGGSAGIDSLERFKSYWGARQELNWVFGWKNPFWRELAGLKSWIARHDP